MTDQIFSPAFGNRPRELVGRDEVVSGIVEGLASVPGTKERAVVLLGQRGYGKTVLLLEIAERARNLGYLVTSPTVVTRGMLTRILEKISDETEKRFPIRKRKLAGGGVGFLGFSAEVQLKDEAKEKKSFAAQIAARCRKINAQGKGLLILLDEIQANNEELRELLIAYQEMVGEGMNVALMLAGLPGSIASALNDHVLTFFNRARKLELQPLDIYEIEVYYTRAFQECGVRIGAAEIREAAKKTEGSPYLMQLIGHYLTVSAEKDIPVSRESFDLAMRRATEEFINDICGTSIRALSEKDVDFLIAMAEDERESRLSDIGSRLGASSAYVQTYKRRLIQAGIIEQVRRGAVRFSIPHMRAYLNRNL